MVCLIQQVAQHIDMEHQKVNSTHHGSNVDLCSIYRVTMIHTRVLRLGRQLLPISWIGITIHIGPKIPKSKPIESKQPMHVSLITTQHLCNYATKEAP